MTPEELKQAIYSRGYTIKAFAEILGVHPDSLQRILAGRKPMTEQLRRHIMLALKENTVHPLMQYQPAGNEAPFFLQVPFELPPELWQIVNSLASQENCSPDEYIEQFCVNFAKNIARGIIRARFISGE